MSRQHFKEISCISTPGFSPTGLPLSTAERLMPRAPLMKMDVDQPPIEWLVCEKCHYNYMAFIPKTGKCFDCHLAFKKSEQDRIDKVNNKNK